MNETSSDTGATDGSPATAHQHGRVATSDHLELVWNSWTPAAPKAVMVIIHGLAEHGGRYRDTAEFFSGKGLAVYTCDLRAHGLSPDPPGAGRVHVDRFEDFLKDADALTGLASRAHPGLPLYLLGHSMGGLISIRYALEHPDRLAGAIISSPALATHPEFKPPLFLRILVSILSRLAPRMLFPSELDSEAISRDPRVVKAYADDPLVSSKVSARWYREILKSMKKAFRDAGTLGVPMLLMQSGSDRLVDPDAARRWAAETPASLVELKNWEGLYHEMFNEPEKDQVRERVMVWLEALQRS